MKRKFVSSKKYNYFSKLNINILTIEISSLISEWLNSSVVSSAKSKVHKSEAFGKSLI